MRIGYPACVTCQTGDVFHFISDRPVLDFLATIAERGTTDEEKLARPGDLADWVAEAGLADGRVAVSRTQLEQAIELREAMYRALCALIDGEPPRPVDRDRINAAARHEPPAPRLDPSGAVVRRGSLESVLAALARDCIELFAGPDRARLRRCDGARCTRLFVDRSRGERRRWCGMRGCGDRAKAAAYRRRQRAAH
jgi:predicted RNA-binding Zn ribbon-like protein